MNRPAGTAPATAVYFVSKLYYGHSYEALFTGDSTNFTSAVAASLQAATGSISAKAASQNLTTTNVGRGLVPNGGSAIFAASQGDV